MIDQAPARAPGAVRDRLLDAAEQLFYADGIASTGVDAVLERAHVATGSLYKNFGGKDGLVEAYLDHREQRWRAHWEACVEAEDDPVERVLAIFTAVETWDPRSPVNRGCAFVAAGVQLPAGHRATRVLLDHTRHLTAQLGRLCAALGPSSPDAVDDLVKDVLLVYEGMISLVTLGVEPAAADRARRLARARIECQV